MSVYGAGGASGPSPLFGSNPLIWSPSWRNVTTLIEGSGLGTILLISGQKGESMLIEGFCWIRTWVANPAITFEELAIFCRVVAVNGVLGLAGWTELRAYPYPFERTV